MNASHDVDFSDLIDYSALGDDVDSAASFAATTFDPSYPSTSSRVGTGPQEVQSQLLDASLAAYSTPHHASSTSPASGYSSASTYPVTSGSSLYPSVTSSYVPPSSFYSSPPALDAQSFFVPQSASSSASSTLAIQSQMIQNERNRRNAALQQQEQQQHHHLQQEQHLRQFSLDPASVSATQPSLQPAATTISPSMMTNTPFFPSFVSNLPVASTSKASSVVGSPAPVSTKKTASSSTKAKSAKASSSSTSATATLSSSSIPTSSSQQRWEKTWLDIKAQLTSSRLQKAPTSTAQRLLALLTPFNHVEGPSSTLSDWGDGSDVPPSGRKVILSELLKFAGDEFWRAWVQEGDSSSSSSSISATSGSSGSSTSKSSGVEVLNYWFEGASKSFEAKKDKEKVKEKDSTIEEADKKRKEVEDATLALVLLVFAKLPIAFRHLATLITVAKRVRKISLKGDEGAVKAAATRLYEKWKKLQEDHHKAQGLISNSTASSASVTSSTSKDKNGSTRDKDLDLGKRKSNGLEEAPSKKAKITTTTTTASSGSAPKKVSSAPASYAPVATNKLSGNLSFKKKPEAQTDRMTAMRAALNKIKKPDVAVSANPTSATATATLTASTSTKDGSPTVEVLGKNGKPKKYVRWKSDETLEQIRYIEKAIYGEDEAQGKTGLGLGEGEEAEENFRMMEQQEGMTLSMHLDEDEDMEEEIEWYSPVVVIIPDTEDFASLRQEPDSAEARIQTERESTLMAVDPSSTPLDSPTEPPPYAPAVPDADSKVIPLSTDLTSNPQVLAEISAAQAAAVPLGGFAANDQIESLLGQLNTSILPPAHALGQGAPTETVPSTAAPLGGIDPATLDALKGYDVAQIRQILDTQPAFRGMTVENLGLSSTAAGGGYGPPPQGSYGHESPHPYASSWSHPNYNSPWQTSSGSGSGPPPGPPPSSTHNAYNGYVPPVSSSSMYEHMHGGGPLPPQRQALKKGKKFGLRKTVPCRFFRTPRGCEWGDKCSFIHDSS